MASSTAKTSFVTPFFIENVQLALPVEAVDRVDRAVEITPLPGSPPVVLGAINARGAVIPVVNIRQRFMLPDRPLSVSDWLILGRTRTRRVAIVADRVSSPIEIPEAAVVSSVQGLPSNKYLKGVAVLDQGLVLIHDLDRFLSLEEDRALHAALQKALNGSESPHA